MHFSGMLLVTRKSYAGSKVIHLIVGRGKDGEMIVGFHHIHITITITMTCTEYMHNTMLIGH